MILHRHGDLERAAPAPGLSRIISMDQNLGSGATPATLCVAYPSVNVGTYFVDGIEY
jgi:hypothetical protein